MKQVYYPKSDGALRGVPAEGVADKQQSAATCLGARGKPSPLNIKFCVFCGKPAQQTAFRKTKRLFCGIIF